jgi:glycosyltransferase involved in cell wall biosynthesis
MKFLMISTFYPPYNFGGDGTHIYRLTNELAKIGHHVDVVHCIDSYNLLTSDGPKGNYPINPNVRVFGLKSPVGYLSPLLTQQTGVPFFKARTIKKLINQNEYDVINYHNMSLIGITALAYGDCIKLYTTHEHWLICPMHVLWKHGREACDKKECIPCQLSGKRPLQLWRYTSLLHQMTKQVDGFISPSRFTMKRHLNAGLNLPMRHIPYFLPTKDDSYKILDTDKSIITDKPYFLFVGRLEKIKGLQNLIPVFLRNPRYELMIAGDGDYETNLRQLAGDAPNIRFLGRLDFNILRALYDKALAVIVPSICYEVFGIIIIESFSMKTPVIVNNFGAMPEVIEDSQGGFVYNNEEELLEYMDRLANEPGLRDTLAQKGYDAYLRLWSEKAHIKQYLHYIDELRDMGQGGAKI